MYYAISVPLIMTENMRFWSYIRVHSYRQSYRHSFFGGTLILDEWPTYPSMHTAVTPIEMTLCVLVVNILTFTPT